MINCSKNASAPGWLDSSTLCAIYAGETCPKWMYGLNSEVTGLAGSFCPETYRERSPVMNFSRRRSASCSPPLYNGDGPGFFSFTRVSSVCASW
ncbi:MAG: hypothetical protein A4E41_00316 [Methanoregulaceae archaeon PtaU1.Bin066]|nr:MAG: hypothetical protein A4E41_00316 [Methanoregulaceae archaeon PtaU1.Bin066]